MTLTPFAADLLLATESHADSMQDDDRVSVVNAGGRDNPVEWELQERAGWAEFQKARHNAFPRRHLCSVNDAATHD